MQHTTLISTAYARALLRAVADQGHDCEQFLAVQCLSLADIDSSHTMDAAVFGRLYQQAIHLLDDESIGMVSVGPVRKGTFRMMCLSVIHRPSLSGIVHRAGEFFDVCLGGGLKPVLFEHEGYMAIGFDSVAAEVRSVEDILSTEQAVRIRTSFFMWHSLLSWFAGQTLPMANVVFGFDAPAKGERWQELFRCPVSFSAARSMLRFDPDVLEAPNIQTEQSLSVFLKSAPYRLIVPSFHEQKVSDRVIALLGDNFSQAMPGAQVVSRQLGMSVSTLRRHLLAEGTSFQMLKDDCRRGAAIQYLASKDLSFTEIAGLLGYDEQSAFYRAFKRWTGKTPSQYRTSLLQ